MTKTYCDHCNKEWSKTTWIYMGVDINPCVKKLGEICPDCLKELEKWMKQPSKEV
jgi:hypothetical protein